MEAVMLAPVDKAAGKVGVPEEALERVVPDSLMIPMTGSTIFCVVGHFF
jgi:hypothetical protein